MDSQTFSNVSQLLTARLVLAVVAASLGALAAIAIKKITHLTLCLLISFAAGALLAVTLFDIFPEAWDLVGFLPAAAAFLSGYVLFYLITKFVFHICPACAATHTETTFRAVTLAMLVALSIHSFMDGLAIYGGALTARPGGFLILMAVAYHKFPEGLALSLVARQSGMNRPRSFLISFGMESVTTVAGGLAGLFFILPEAPWVGFVLAHVGGGFAYLVIHALFSGAIRNHPKWTLFAALVGGGSVLATGYAIGAF